MPQMVKRRRERFGRSRAETARTAPRLPFLRAFRASMANDPRSKSSKLLPVPASEIQPSGRTQDRLPNTREIGVMGVAGGGDIDAREP